MINQEMIEIYKTLYPDVRKVLGPYIRNSDGRRFVSIFLEGKKTTKQFCRFKMEVYLKRKLEKDETVDHIDRDFLNDDIDNLQVLSWSDHVQKDAKRRKPVFEFCLYCNKYFELTRDQVANSFRKNVKNGPFCSRSCAGKYGTDVQNNRNTIPNKRTEILVEYYYED